MSVCLQQLYSAFLSRGLCFDKMLATLLNVKVRAAYCVEVDLLSIKTSNNVNNIPMTITVIYYSFRVN